ncbi:insulinoma-associated protein 1-like [Heptranchias perlo]|uniref:insulinoma-associated protein 1-like n=1 Tax=Heptranchias perlo TaxID=212740 RepID=UPI003559FA4E
MPRGFLVKRTKRAALVSYRVRCSEEEGERVPSPWGGEGDAPSPQAPRPGFGLPVAPGARARSPSRPLSRPLGSSSPVLAESFPSPSSLACSLGRGVFLASVSDQEVEMGSNCAPEHPAERQQPSVVKAKARGKRPRLERKTVKDEVTTSPVLGLMITKERMEAFQPSAGARPLGEFICQLCKEAYPGALSLAQHKCSRIVQVEYRCPECAKLFSCPANLASHCRWHKPRNPGAPQAQEAAGEGGKSQREGWARPPEDELFDCPLCSKRFRRQAYLRKHAATHRAPVLSPGSQRFIQRAEGAKPGAVTSSVIVADSSPPPPAQPGLQLTFRGAEVLPVKPYPEMSFSSCPVLSRHVKGKCHPVENRQVVVFQLSEAHTVI